MSFFAERQTLGKGIFAECIHFAECLTLGKEFFAECLFFAECPSVHTRQRVPDFRHSAKSQTLGKDPFFGSDVDV